MQEHPQRIYRFIEAFEKLYGRTPKPEDAESDFKIKVAQDAQMSVGGAPLDDLPKDTVVDGEIVALDDTGRPNFNPRQTLRVAGAYHRGLPRPPKSKLFFRTISLTCLTVQPNMSAPRACLLSLMPRRRLSGQPT